MVKEEENVLSQIQILEKSVFHIVLMPLKNALIKAWIHLFFLQLCINCKAL